MKHYLQSSVRKLRRRTSTSVASNDRLPMLRQIAPRPADDGRNAQSAEDRGPGGINDRRFEGLRTTLPRCRNSISDASSRDANGRETKGGRRNQEGQRSRAHKTSCGLRLQAALNTINITCGGFQSLRRDYIICTDTQYIVMFSLA